LSVVGGCLPVCSLHGDSHPLLTPIVYICMESHICVCIAGGCLPVCSRSLVHSRSLSTYLLRLRLRLRLRVSGSGAGIGLGLGSGFGLGVGVGLGVRAWARTSAALEVSVAPPSASGDLWRGTAPPPPHRAPVVWARPGGGTEASAGRGPRAWRAQSSQPQHRA